MLDITRPLFYIYGILNNSDDAGLAVRTRALEHQQKRLRSISTRLKLKVSKRARRMTLRLDPDTRHVHLIVPSRTDFNYAFNFAEEHRTWIREKLSSLPKPVPFRDGAILPFFGRDHYLEIIKDRSLRRTSISVKNRIMTVETPLDDPSEKIEAYLRRWAAEELEQIASEKTALIRRRLRAVRVRETKSRWGSCAEDGNLSFSWRLIFAPRWVVDYVVAHEIAHMIHFDHSDNFWRLCERLSVNFDSGRDWLKDHGASLMCYGAKN